MEDDAPPFTPFTEAEHAAFLVALEKIGTGDITVRERERERETDYLYRNQTYRPYAINEYAILRGTSGPRWQRRRGGQRRKCARTATATSCSCR